MADDPPKNVPKPSAWELFNGAIRRVFHEIISAKDGLQKGFPGAFKALVAVGAFAWVLFNALLGAWVSTVWPKIHWEAVMIIGFCLLTAGMVLLLFWVDVKTAQKYGYHLFVGSWLVAGIGFVGLTAVSFINGANRFEHKRELLDTTNHFDAELVDATNYFQNFKVAYESASNDLLKTTFLYTNAQDERYRFNMLLHWADNEYSKENYKDASRLFQMSFDAEYEYGPSTGKKPDDFLEANWPWYAFSRFKETGETDSSIQAFNAEIGHMLDHAIKRDPEVLRGEQWELNDIAPHAPDVLTQTISYAISTIDDCLTNKNIAAQ
jgi:hypothetical protein